MMAFIPKSIDPVTIKKDIDSLIANLIEKEICDDSNQIC